MIIEHLLLWTVSISEEKEHIDFDKTNWNEQIGTDMVYSSCDTILDTHTPYIVTGSFTSGPATCRRIYKDLIYDSIITTCICREGEWTQEPWKMPQMMVDKIDRNEIY